MRRKVEKVKGYELVTRTDEVAMYKVLAPCSEAYNYVVFDVNKTPNEEFPYMLKHYRDKEEAQEVFDKLVDDDIKDKEKDLEPCLLMFDCFYLTFDKNEINGISRTTEDISKAMKFNFIVAKAIKSTLQQTIIIVKA